MYEPFKVVAIVGSRDFPNLPLVEEFVEMYLRPGKHALVSGLARGVDTRARDACRDRGIHTIDVEALWAVDGNFNRGAGLERNPLIVQLADTVVAFRVDKGQKSRGTDDAITWARVQGKPCVVFYPRSSIE